jgi:GT2 family glycosyltransferase
MAERVGARAGARAGVRVPEPEISVVIPTYRRAAVLPELLGALAQQTLPVARFEVVVVDDCSEVGGAEGVDGLAGVDVVDLVEKLAAEVPYRLRALRTPVNSGPAVARNLGWRNTSGTVVAFLDDDCLPDPGWLSSGLTIMESDQMLGVMQGRVRTPDDFDPAGMPNWYHCQIIDQPTPYFEACNIFYRRDALEAAGGFDEGIGWWGEDSMLGWQVVEAGWKRGFTADAAVVHAVVERGWRWHFDNGLLDSNMVKIAQAHPGFRQEAFWQHWAVRKADAGFVLAVVALLAAVRFRPALLLVLPYLWLRRPHWDFPHPLRYAAESIALDAAHTAGTLRGAVESRVLVI